MSNLSLSFSFYFWWINSSRSVTLTNNLSQSVNVYPTDSQGNALCLLWYGNTPYGWEKYPLTLPGGNVGTGSCTLGETTVIRTDSASSYNVYYGADISIDFSKYSKVRTLAQNANSSTYGCVLVVTRYNTGERSNISVQYINTTFGIYEIDTSSISETAYVALTVEPSGILNDKAVWLVE